MSGSLGLLLQKEWRELWGLNQAFPSDCEGCFNANGGGIVKGLGSYLFQKYPEPGQVMGGLISTQSDEIMTMFYSRGLDNCVGSACIMAEGISSCSTLCSTNKPTSPPPEPRVRSYMYALITVSIATPTV